jgi:DNA-binding response OmpR family regulator
MSNSSGGFYEFGSFRLDLESRRLTQSGQPVALAPKTLDMLLLLVRSEGRLLTKAQ